MFEKLRRRFRRVQVQPMSLRFTMDRTEDNQHRVQVFKSIKGVEEVVSNPLELSQYGYQEMHDSARGQIIYVVDESQRQQLRAIASLNPQIDSDGALRFSIAPRILSYLRSKGDTDESEHSRRLHVSDKPLKPVARISYNPDQGLEINTGYRVDGEKERLVRADEVATRPDGEYAAVGDAFYPAAEGISGKAEAWLRRVTQRIGLDKIPEFFLRDLVLLQREFDAVLVDDAERIRVLDEAITPVVRVAVNQPGWLDFQVDYECAGMILPEGLLPKTSGKQYLQVDDVTWITYNQSAVAAVRMQLEKLGATPEGDGYRISITEFGSLEDFVAQIGGRSELSAAYQQFIAQLTGFQADDAYPLSPDAEADLVRRGVRLRPYQRAGIHWLTWLQQNRLHGVLADDMGLGKTLQAIATMRQAYEQSGSLQHSLIVAPKSVLLHWEREIHRFYPKARTYQYHGPHRQDLFKASTPIIFISTYATVTRDISSLSRVSFFYLILDEATNIKNPDTGRTRAAKALNSVHRLALTGTPVENRPAELWSLFDFLMRGHLGRYGTFVNRFENGIVEGDQQAADRLGRRIHPFLLRRLKVDVAQDLPEKIDMDEWCELTEEQRQLYGSLQDRVKDISSALLRGEHVNYATNILPVLSKLKQICDHPALVTGQAEPLAGRSAKFDWITERIAGIVEESEQVVVFSHFLGMLNLLEMWLRQQQIRYMRIDGSTSDRQGLIDAFNNGQASVALCSLMAAGHGINLTAANHVIHADRWWNPAVEDQATDRVHRIGQDKTVYVYRILTEGTLEERIDTLLASKRAMTNSIISAATASAHSWTRDELLELLRPLD